jgi:transcriptional antiterminator RfaH
MPVLAVEPNVWPTNLFSEDSPTRLWWVLHTRPRAEKMLARRLLRSDVSFYLPLYEQSRRIQRRTVRSYLPLFSGYLFLSGDADGRQTALETNLVAGCLPVADQNQLDNELLHIHRLIESGSQITPESRLQPGTPAEIVSGPLAGCRGKILRCGNAMKFVIEVNFLQQGASVEVDASMIQPL